MTTSVAPGLLAVLMVAAGASAAPEGDLSVGWIERRPAIDFVWGSQDPSREGWPEPGQVVTWRAHVTSWTERRLDAVAYRWLLDGSEVTAGTVDIDPLGFVVVELDWTWTFDRHRVTFEIDTDDRFVEESERNNRLTIFTDAISVGFWAEQSFYNRFREILPGLGFGATCFEDWVQLQVRFFNDMAPLAVYPESPDGVLDRLRIDEIVVVPDGALPVTPVPPEIAGETPVDRQGGNYPDIGDRTVDLQWGFPAWATAFYDVDSAHVLLDNALLHELGHARYLLDVYGSYVQQDPPGHVIGFAPLPPLMNGRAHLSNVHGLMNQHYTWMDRYSAAALNLIAGHRAVRGSWNSPENRGEFLNDLPAQNLVRIVDPDGHPLPRASVRVFQSTPPPGGPSGLPYCKHFDSQPDLELVTDDDGVVAMGRNPFATGGPVVHDDAYSNVVAVVQVTVDGLTRYGYLEVWGFNLAFWRGDTEVAEHELVVGGAVCPSDKHPVLEAPIEEAVLTSAEVTLEWRGFVLGGEEQYHVWASADNGPVRLLGTTRDTALTVSIGGDVQWWVEADYPDCPSARSGTGRFTALHPTLRRPTGRRRP